MRKGLVGPCVLALLRTQARYGLGIAQELQQAGLIGSAGTIYPVLSRLEATGHVLGRWVVDGDERPRRFYELTEQGRIEVDQFRTEWLAFATAVSTMLNGEGKADG